MVTLIASISACGSPIPSDTRVAPEARPDECVILLHGLARRDASMRPLQTTLVDHGYQVVNQGYPSRDFPVKSLSERAIPDALQACRRRGASRIHFITHSLGGILVRHYLENHAVPDVGRVVMLAPPNQGSEVPDNWREVPGFEWYLGPAGRQLGTDGDSVPARLGPVRVDTAVIAGTRSINPILSLSLPNPDDGKVSVVRTRVANMCAHLQLPVSHPLIMRDADAMTEALNYLSTGRFLSEKAEYPDCPFRDV